MLWKKRAVLGVGVLAMTGMLFGCGTQSSSALTSKFMTVDPQNQSVTINLVAGYNATDNWRNFDGYSNGQMTITVPVGYKVTLNYSNASGIPTDVGVYTQNPQRALAFTGAGDSLQEISLNAAGGLLPGDSEKETFTASRTGSFILANYLDRYPQIASGWAPQDYQAVDMWAHFDVVQSGSPSITAQ